jgi:ribonuclease D
MRESTYYPKLCLVQAATDSYCVLIDALALENLQPLLTFLADQSRTKVLHAARQDIEVLSLAAHSDAPIPAPIFDTQVAAGLLGHPAQIGYGDLVAKCLDHTLQKGQARTDWTRRPLSLEQLTYAADDVRYLVPLYHHLLDALTQRGRLAWLYEDALAFSNPTLYRTSPETAWQRLRGLEQMPPQQRAIVKALASWREQRAMQHDKPRGWILSDEALRAIAERAPSDLEELEQIRSVPPGVVKKRAAELLQLIEIARGNAANESAAHRPTRPDSRQVALVTRIMGEVRATGDRLKISPELLATRRDVEQLVFSGKAGAFATGWRKAVIGDELLRLAGREGASEP